jgi:hypothetical protein
MVSLLLYWVAMSELIEQENLRHNKAGLLKHYRDTAKSLLADIRRSHDPKDFKAMANAMNKGLSESKDKLLKVLEQKSEVEKWNPKVVLESVLLITYTNYVVMIESRNEVWPYEYMAFSRRIGELWEPFCKLCWDFPINKNIAFIEPPIFKDVRQSLSKQIEDSVSKLNISDTEKTELTGHYDSIWAFITSGEVNLELDLHFREGDQKYVVDLKSGFSSNEKGNTNRLLLVASIYKNLKDGYQCLIFVRSAEEKNNHYLQTLKRSGLWQVFCGQETYDQILKFTGFDISAWLKENVDWKNDFTKSMFDHLKASDLIQYLEW